MGPPLWRGGKGSSIKMMCACIPSFNGAAPVEGRKGGSENMLIDLRLASMGPPLWRGGKVVETARQLHQFAKLQWGRPCGGAERCLISASRVPLKSLQWGRPCGGAERASGRRRPLRFRLASMGPPLWRGGKGWLD